MIDIQLLRTSLDDIAKQLATRGFDLDTPRFRALEDQRKKVQTSTEYYQSQRNVLSKQIGQAKAKKDEKLIRQIMAEVAEFGEKLKGMETDNESIQKEIREFLAAIPNIPHETVPRGASPADNRELRRWGAPRDFAFAVKDHVDVGEALGGLDFAAATKIAGARFVLMRGETARLHRALAQFMLDVHSREHGYTEIYSPYLVNAATAYGTGQLPKFEQDLFAVPHGGEKWYLIPTAEVPVTNIVRDEILPLESLPLRFVCHTPCFRSEAGSYGKDTRGMIRQHQFDKVEVVMFVRPEDSPAALETLTAHNEELLRRLGLPYRVVSLCTGDLGFGSAKTYDLELWAPGVQEWLEVSSASNVRDFQARRANIRFRRGAGAKPEFVHTLNGSGLGLPRTLIGVIENYQQKDGSIVVPEALRPYLGAEVIRCDRT